MRAYLRVLRLAGAYGGNRLELACERALAAGVLSSRYVLLLKADRQRPFLDSGAEQDLGERANAARPRLLQLMPSGRSLRYATEYWGNDDERTQATGRPGAHLGRAPSPLSSPPHRDADDSIQSAGRPPQPAAALA